MGKIVGRAETPFEFLTSQLTSMIESGTEALVSNRKLSEGEVRYLQGQIFGLRVALVKVEEARTKYEEQ